jgi:hypothetical protein
MHLSPLFSSKKIVLSPLSSAGFFFVRGVRRSGQNLIHVMDGSHMVLILDSSAVHATDMRDGSTGVLFISTPTELAGRSSAGNTDGRTTPFLGLARFRAGFFLLCVPQMRCFVQCVGTLI